MKTVWNLVNRVNTDKNSKTVLFLTFTTLAFAVLGALVWSALGRYLLPSVGWLINFIGYPAVVVGLFGGIFYIWGHEFS